MIMSRFLYATVVTLAFSIHALAAPFSFEEKDGRLTLLEGDEPVLVYNYGMVAPPEGVDPDKYTRSCYIHPVYGLDGEVLTQDFPRDHRHQRGVSWTWPESTVGDKPINTWELDSGEQVFEKWVTRETERAYARVAVQNGWRFKGEDETQVRELIDFLVYPADEKGREMDFLLTFTNVSDEPVTLLGAIGKGYGGFSFRPSAERKPMIFSTKDGVHDGDALEYETPWADVSFHLERKGPMAGAAIFQHPSNPDYPHHGWIFRRYALLGAAWPHVDPYVLQPGDEISLRYRLYIHRGDAEAADVAGRFAAFMESLGETP